MGKNYQDDNSAVVSIETTLSNTKFGLENLHLFNGSGEKIHVKKIEMLNKNTLVCEFYPYANNAPDVKAEICMIMGFYYGFLVEGNDIYFKNYAVKAFDDADQMILYALSSKEAVEHAGRGNSIEWLKATLFQENTNDYRLSMAKRMISEIENSLRHVVTDVLEKQFQNNWWDLAMDSKLGSSVKDMYSNQFGTATSDGKILINYTYTIQLKKIITTYWPSFNHFFGDKIDFENSMDELNVIRREEAHNRIVSAAHITSLNTIYSALLSKILIDYPSITPTYLVENWRLQIGEIMREGYQPLYQAAQLLEEVDAAQKLKKSVESTEHLIRYLEDINSKLISLVTPAQKRSIHDELIQRFERYKNLQQEKLALVQAKNWDDLELTIHTIQKYEVELGDFTNRFLSTES